MTMDEGSSGISDSKAWIRGFKTSTGRDLYKSASEPNKEVHIYIRDIRKHVSHVTSVYTINRA